MSAPTGATWLASYPKSGNTWLRLLLESYRIDSVVDINDNRICTGDGAKSLIRSASPLSLQELGEIGEFLVRPAGLMNLFVCQQPGFMVKTHFANLYPEELPPFIPPALTKKAIYMVRDPRSVAVSFSRFFGESMQRTCEIMGSENFVYGGDGDHAKVYTSSWSGHVASWIAETRYPVHLVKYEDMLVEPHRELQAILEFLEWTPNVERIDRAIKNCEISRLAKTENEKGFVESPNRDDNVKFFENGGGTRWQDELGERWVRQIEKDHCKVMTSLGYLEDNVPVLYPEKLREA